MEKLIEYLEGFFKVNEGTRDIMIKKGPIILTQGQLSRFYKVVLLEAKKQQQGVCHLLNYIWNIDWAYDGRRVFNIKMLTQTNIDRYIRINDETKVRHVQFERQAYLDVASTISEEFKVQDQLYEREREVVQDDWMYESLYQIYDFWKISEEQQEQIIFNQEKLESEVLSQLSQFFCSQYIQFSQQQIQNQNFKYYKYALSLQALLAVNKISDSDYVKASLILFIILRALRRKGNVSLDDELQEKIALSVIDLAQHFNNFNKEFHDIEQGFFLRRTKMDSIAVEQNQGVDPVIYLHENQYLLRPQMGIINRQLVDKLPNSVGSIPITSQNDEVAQIIRKMTYEALDNNFDAGAIAALQSKMLSEGFVISVLLQQQEDLTPYIIIIKCVKEQIQKYNYGISSLQANNRIQAFVRVTVAVPKQKIYSDSEKADAFTLAENEMRIQMEQKIDNNQLLDDQGESMEYYTINLDFEYDHKKSLEQSARAVCSLFYRQILNYITMYGATDENNGFFRKFTMGLGVRDGIIKQIYVRPFLISKKAFNLKQVQDDLENLKQKLNEQQDNSQIQKLRISDDQKYKELFDLALQNKVQTRGIDKYEKNPNKKIKKQATISGSDVLMEQLFPPCDIDYNFNNCQKVTINNLFKMTGKERRQYEDFDDSVIIRLLIEQLDKDCLVFNYSQNNVSHQFQQITKMKQGDIVLFTSNTHIFIHILSEQSIKQLDQASINILQQIFLYRLNGNKINIMFQEMQNRDQLLNHLVSLLTQLQGKKNNTRSKIMYKRKEYINQLLDPLKINSKYKFLSNILKIRQQVRIECYYDFETTFNDLHAQYKSGVKKIRLTDKTKEACEQLDFMCGAIYYINIPVKQIILAFIKDIEAALCKEGNSRKMKVQDFKKLKSFVELYVQKYVKQDDESQYEEKIFEGIPSTTSFMNYNNNLMSSIEKRIAILNNFRKMVQEFIKQGIQNKQYNEQIKCIIQECSINPVMTLYAYNGSKFDNQFIIQYMKRQFPQSWFSQIDYIGDLNDNKVLIIQKKFQFKDIRLMTAGGSLASMCKSFKLGQDHSKKSFDMKKMKYLSSVMQKDTYEEIKNYVLFDVKAIAELHRIFRNCIAQNIKDVFFRDGKLNDELQKHEYVQKKDIDLLLQYQIKDWSTMSSLALKFFQQYYNNYTLTGPSETKMYQFMRNAYQGGFTQNFVIGECEKVFYLDFNSMYPALMAKINFPLNLCSFVKMAIQVEGITLTNDIFFNTNWQERQWNNNACYFRGGKIALSYRTNDYDLFEISKFEFFENCKAPMFGIKTKKGGTIYTQQFDIQRDGNLMREPLVLYGFQISQAFILRILKSITYTQHIQFKEENLLKTAPIFQQYIENEYNERMKYKKEGNEAMAQSKKIFLNSTYGKLGEKQHDIRFLLSKKDFQDDNILTHHIKEKMKQSKELDQQLFDQDQKFSLSHQILNDEEDDVVEIKISDFPTHPCHTGGMVYHAGLITAAGRTHILTIINEVQKKGGLVLYADTDSIVLDEKGYKITQQINNIVQLHESVLGAMKNEYPLNNDQHESSISKFRVLNKKIYQYELLQGVTVNKFKGYQNPQDDFYQKFIDDVILSSMQTRFKRQKGGVTICQSLLNYQLRLSRNIGAKISDQLTFLEPFKSLYNYNHYYDDINQHVVFDQKQKNWHYYYNK